MTMNPRDGREAVRGWHAALTREEFGSEPDLDVSELTDRLKAARRWGALPQPVRALRHPAAGSAVGASAWLKR
jgi:hypothetical protein